MNVGLRVGAIIVFVVAIILFIIGAVPTAGPDLKDIAFGLAAVAASLALWCLATLVPNNTPGP